MNSKHLLREWAFKRTLEHTSYNQAERDSFTPETLAILCFDSVLPKVFLRLFVTGKSDRQEGDNKAVKERFQVRMGMPFLHTYDNTAEEAGLFVTDKIYICSFLLRKSLFSETLSHVRRIFSIEAVIRCVDLVVQHVLCWKVPLRGILKGWCSE